MSEKSENDSYLLGQSVGLEEASIFLLEKGSIYYKLGEDQTAKLLRSLAKDLQKLSDERYTHPKI